MRLLQALLVMLLLLAGGAARGDQPVISMLKKQPVDLFTFGIDRAERALNQSLSRRMPGASGNILHVQGDLRAIVMAVRETDRTDANKLCEVMIAEVKFAFGWNHFEGKPYPKNATSSALYTYFASANGVADQRVGEKLDEIFDIHAFVTSAAGPAGCRSRVREKTVRYD